MKRYLLYIVMVFLLTSCGGQATGQSDAGTSDIEPEVGEGTVQVGESAPYFRLPTTNGGVVDLEEMQGKVIILNFWATWCAPCRVEMPELQAAYDDYREDGLEVIGVEVETSGSPTESREFLDGIGVTFPNVRDEGGRMEERYLRRPALPTSIFIDREGTVQFVQIGPMTRSFIEEQLDELGF